MLIEYITKYPLKGRMDDVNEDKVITVSTNKRLAVYMEHNNKRCPHCGSKIWVHKFALYSDAKTYIPGRAKQTGVCIPCKEYYTIPKASHIERIQGLIPMNIQISKMRWPEVKKCAQKIQEMENRGLELNP
jgi:predicted RNA-binding Zn-ribbon protein involved in translation (DUF1610 family)